MQSAVMKRYPEYKKLDLTNLAKEMLTQWEQENLFEQSVSIREGADSFVFYEGPPSANGMPGIHHVMGRTIKDLFCRYKTQKGFQVNRKAGWDTHGLPVELGVEKELGITKADIGRSISVEDYNDACRKAVMKYTDVWNDLTRKMGYWVDLSDPYITYKSKYMESVWYLLKQMYQKDFMYKGYTIQPYSPKAGTGLSTAELNMPGCYRDVTDTTVVGQFKVVEDERSKPHLDKAKGDLFFLAWTTTPWTLPSNTALAVGKKINYVQVQTYNQYTFEPVTVILAEALVGEIFKGKFVVAEDADTLAAYTQEAKKIPYFVVDQFVGADLLGMRYEQLLPYTLPMADADAAFQVIEGDFVTTEDGTGIVHIAPTFGADDARVAKAAGVPPMLVANENGDPEPLVDLEGKFVAAMGEMGGKYVKSEYYKPEEMPEKSADVELAIKLKTENRAFKVEKYKHSYPHCWRTDKPVLYYPLDSWFVKVTKAKERMVSLNDTINWKPKSTGTGRFGNWLENANDWNLSRSRYWGIPLPIWRTEDGTEEACIGSVEELKAACEKAVAAGVMDANPLADFEPGNMSEENYDQVDLHKNHMDQITLVSESGRPMTREADLIDVWFDSGSMPYAQWHYPFENKEVFDRNYPADFIAEGVDQTRGWFYTLHAIAAVCFDSVAYKNVLSNGLVLDKKGFKMAKSRGNGVDPFKTLDQHGADATRWYMMSSASPWDNLRFDPEGIDEVRRRFFGTLYNTYSFFSLYANLDDFDATAPQIPVAERPEIDRWIISRLNSLTAEVDSRYADYDPTKATRAIQDFVADHLSNWHVRLSRRRFWKNESGGSDKQAAYQTLHHCLKTVAQLAAPVAPFYMDRLYRDLHGKADDSSYSVHLADFPESKAEHIDSELEERMSMAQQATSLVLSLRKKENLRVRQPLQKIMIPVLNPESKARLQLVENLILSETNVKTLEYLEDAGFLVKQIKANFKVLGPRYGKSMKTLAGQIAAMSQDEIRALEQQGSFTLDLEGTEAVIGLDDVEITSQDIPGWQVASEGGLTVALDITLTPELKEEGIAREFVNRIQNLRKDRGLEVTDKIKIKIENRDLIESAINRNLKYICSETLADSLELVEKLGEKEALAVEVEAGLETWIAIDKV